MASPLTWASTSSNAESPVTANLEESQSEHGRIARGSGLARGIGAYTIWGLFPAFFGLLSFAAPLDILAHRVIWTLAVMVAVLGIGRQFGALRGLPARTWLLVAAGAASISMNWGTYVFAVLSDQVAEAALGYFINPLVSVAIGVIVFREKLSRAGTVAIALAVVAVVVLTVDYHRLPLIALTLAGSFALYGVVKKLTPLPPKISLTAETLSVAPFAAGYLTWAFVVHHQGIADSPEQFGLLVLSGPVTAVPLLLFGAAAHRLPIVSIGVLQYLTPIMQFLWAVLVRHEQLSTTAWAGFALIWAALSIFTTDAVRSAKRRPPQFPR